jgi:hypothetical protein
MGWVAAWFGTTFLFAVPSEAQVSDRRLDLIWTAPEGCPNDREVRAVVESYLGGPIEGHRDVWVARGVVSREKGAGWRLRLDMSHDGSARVRTLQGDSCEAVTNAGALVLAFAIDPQAAGLHAPSMQADVPAPTERRVEAAFAESRPSEPPSPEPPSREPGETASASPLAAPHPPAIESIERAPLPRAARARNWSLRMLVGVDAGALPQPTGWAGLAVRRAFGPFSIELGASYFAPRRRELSGPNGLRGGDFDLGLLALGGCYAFASGALEFGPCAGGEAGTVRASGFGVGNPGDGKGLWLAGTGVMAARWRVAPWLGVAAQAGFAFPLARPVYYLDNVGPVYRSDAVTFRGSGGLEALF